MQPRHVRDGFVRVRHPQVPGSLIGDTPTDSEILARVIDKRVFLEIDHDVVAGLLAAAGFGVERDVDD